MDITSHSITLISNIVGLGLTELLLNLHRLIHARDRLRWDPLPVLWTATVLLMLLNYWLSADVLEHPDAPGRL
jgi:hypothetical protein